MPPTSRLIDPGPCRWDLHVREDVSGDLMGVGADLEPATILHAYCRGLFPMGVGQGGQPPIGWWCPEQRGVLLPGDHHVQRSLRRRSGRFEVTIDTAFDEVVSGCADPNRDGRWITADIHAAYRRLHDLGWAHSVEVRDADGEVVGGLYGLALGGLFAGESMFHRATDASKFALWALADMVFADGDPRRVIDVQWQTPHLRSQGVREISRSTYLELLPAAFAAPLPDSFAPGHVATG